MKKVYTEAVAAKQREKSDKFRQSLTASNPFSFIEDYFKDYIKPANCYLPFDYLVAVAGRIDSPGPRDEQWELILDFGKPLLEKVLKGEGIGAGPHFFIFPDRWLVPAEAQLFFSQLCKNPDAKKFGRVYVVTHQPYLVGDCLKEQCRILYKKK